MSAAGEFPNEPLDGAIFADTGWEPRAVYDHLAWLKSVLPFPVHMTNNGNIREGILNRRKSPSGRFATVPWFITMPDGKKAMGRRQCSSEHKLTPIMWKTRELLGKGRKESIPRGAVEVWIGISRDEASRMKDARQKYLRNSWPLIERNMTRADCLEWLKAHGYAEPPKSACIGCPFHNAAMWRDMKKNDPVSFADAVAVDAALRVGHARGMRGVEYMHVARKPLEEAVAESAARADEQPNLFLGECEGICGV